MPIVTFGDPTLPDDFWQAVIPEPNTGCWLWLGSSTPDGYGHVRWDGGWQYTHRLAVVASGRAIPAGMVTDHRCELTCCCNPAHLDIITSAENTRRHHQRRWRERLLIGRCPAGHPLIEANFIRRAGREHLSPGCRPCLNARVRARKAAPQ